MRWSVKSCSLQEYVGTNHHWIPWKAYYSNSALYCVILWKNSSKILIEHYTIIGIQISKFGDHCRGWSEGSLFNSYYTLMWRRALHHSRDCSTWPLILYPMILSPKHGRIENYFWVFGMIRPRIEPRSPGQLVTTLLNSPVWTQVNIYKYSYLLQMIFKCNYLILYIRIECFIC